MDSTAGTKSSVVFYTTSLSGHLIPMVELARVLANRGLPVTIVVLDPPNDAGYTAAFIERHSKAHPGVSFHRLPPVELPHLDNMEALTFALIQLSNANLRHYLSSLSVTALLLDFFCGAAVNVASELGIPFFFFFSSSACGLAALVHLPVIDKTITRNFEDLGDSLIHFPCLPPIPASHMPFPLLDRGGEGYTQLLRTAIGLMQSDGIIVNAIEALELAAVEAIRSGHCVPEGMRSPPIYCIGPLIFPDEQEDAARAECLSWLDSQPAASVIFLSFGSRGCFSLDQLREIANGLESSGQRFLWVVRSPSADDPSAMYESGHEPDLSTLLPAGFLDRTRGRGFVVKSWAPQKSVLAHRSVGGFVTHLGWNSVLEAIHAGVPMVGWPLYGEQRMNKVFLTAGLDLIGVMEDYDKPLVAAALVDARVRWLMESEDGRVLRMKTSAAKKAAAVAMTKNGPSQMALEELARALSSQRVE